MRRRAIPRYTPVAVAERDSEGRAKVIVHRGELDHAASVLDPKGRTVGHIDRNGITNWRYNSLLPSVRPGGYENGPRVDPRLIKDGKLTCVVDERGMVECFRIAPK